MQGTSRAASDAAVLSKRCWGSEESDEPKASCFLSIEILAKLVGVQLLEIARGEEYTVNALP